MQYPKAAFFADYYVFLLLKCAPYQGRIFSRDGSSGVTVDGAGNQVKYSPLSQTSYGEPDGLFGINCGHVQYPFIPGVNIQRYFPYNEEKNAERYEEFQKQRAMERDIKATKRECMMLQAAGDEEGLQQASQKLRQQKQKYNQFCNDKNLGTHYDRTQVYGYDRSKSAKTVWAERKAAKPLDNGGGSGIINTGYKMAADESFTLNDKVYQKHFDKEAVEKSFIFAKEKLMAGTVDFSLLENSEVIQPMLDKLYELKQKHAKHFFQILVDDTMSERDFASVAPDGSLHLNAKYMNSAAATADFLDRMKKKRLLPIGHDNTEFIITHEFMHFVSRDEVDNKRSKVHKLIPDENEKSKKLPSLNSKINDAEYVADVMAMVEFGEIKYSVWKKIYKYFL